MGIIYLVENQSVAVVFGTEKYGLTNEELDLCQILMTIPGNPDCGVVDIILIGKDLNGRSYIQRKIIRVSGDGHQDLAQI
jgi:hypothetical protein